MAPCALVTGGAGFIGSHLVSALLAEGYAVRVIDDLSTGRLANLEGVLDRIEFHRGDIRQAALVAELCRGVDFVLHQASLVSVPASIEDPEATYEIIVRGTLNVLEAARREGTVAVIGPTGDDRRAALTEGFERTYGITVDYLADAGAGIPPRLAAERGADQYRWDVFIGGTTTGLESLIPMGVFDPLEPALILPEVTDPANWLDGRLEFADNEGEYDLVFILVPMIAAANHPDQVRPEEIDELPKLLDPKWRGKIVISDPLAGG
ncbi:MAG: GDP-mannose 4,6-dehydratase, partial [Firmicutes bacterium]|nr:GDP-mannose 4,6-dehydratase [Bacillota bacterium]